MLNKGVVRDTGISNYSNSLQGTVSMTIYYSKRSYRRIYEKHHGKIPKDSDGRSYEIHHIDGDHNNCDISNLKLVTIEEHYSIHYAQGDWAACLMMAHRMRISPEERSRFSRQIQLDKLKDGTHPFLDRALSKQRELTKVKQGTHPFVGGKIQSESNQRRLRTGEHHLLGPTQNNNRLKQGTHPSQTKVTCLCCRKMYSVGNFVRYHGVKCSHPTNK